jgi:hypothetical protein
MNLDKELVLDRLRDWDVVDDDLLLFLGGELIRQELSRFG